MSPFLSVADALCVGGPVLVTARLALLFLLLNSITVAKLKVSATSTAANTYPTKGGAELGLMENALKKLP